MVLESLTDWLIVLAVVLVLFGGASKIPELARAMGRAVGEFKKGQAEIERELRSVTTVQDSSGVPQGQTAQQGKQEQSKGN